MSLSLYRKYRPNVFSDVVGQEHVEHTLINAVTEGTVAHAYLFCGPRGTGKTTTARLLAKALLCERGPGHEPDGTCAQCRAIAEGTHPDVYELDAASRTGVDNVRDEIISRVSFAPTQGRYKVYIIDEVHMLTTQAFNALLKTLEEPPEHVVFVMCTTDPHKVPDTIQSRCQRFDFRRLSIPEIVGYLERICAGEGFEYEPEALEYLAARSSGGMRDATTSLEQVAVFSDGKVTMEQTTSLFGELPVGKLFELCDHIAHCDTAGCLVWTDRLVSTGIDLARFAHDLTGHVRNLYVTQVTGGEGGIVSCSAEELERYRQQAASFGGPERLARAMNVCGELVSELRRSSDARLSVEIALVCLCRPESDLTLESLAQRIEALEARIPAGGACAAPVQAAPQSTPQETPATRPDEPQWETVAPPEPAWKQTVRDSFAAGQTPAQPAAAERMPLAEAVAREKEREEAAAFEAQDAAGKRPEPQPAPAAAEEPLEDAPACTPTSSGMSPARLLAALLTIVKREDVATGALLNGVSLDVSDNGYVLLFPKGSEFAMKIASGSDASALIGRAFEEVLGQRPRFACKIGTAARDVRQPEQAQAPEPDVPPSYDEPPYDEGYYASFGNPDEPDFDAPDNGYAPPLDDETAAEFADALSVFGDGIKVQEIKDPDQER